MALPDSSHRRPHLDERCARHQFEAAVDQCRQCGYSFCEECVVYAFGARQPPYCIPCALAAAGVRSGAARQPAVPKKELRRREKEARRVAKEAQHVAAADASVPQIDWSLPIVPNGAGSAAPATNGNGNGAAPSPDSDGEEHADGSHSSPPPSSGSTPPGTGSPADAAFPTFEDAPAGRPQPPTAPAKAPGRTGLFGRKKDRVVPF